MGYGDERLYDFDLKNNKKEIVKFMKEKFKDQPAFIMDFIKPSKNYGIHSFDIVTITLPNGDIQIVSCIMWCDCDEDTSHTCSNGYSIDVWDGKVVGGIGQYSAHFNQIKSE